MEIRSNWPITASVIIKATPEKWEVELHAQGPDRRYYGDLITYDAYHLDFLQRRLPEALETYRQLTEAIPSGVEHEVRINDSSPRDDEPWLSYGSIAVKIGGYDDGLCIAPQARWKTDFIVSAAQVPELMECIATAKSQGEELLALARRLA